MAKQGKFRVMGMLLVLVMALLALAACDAGGGGGSGGNTPAKSNADLLKEAAANMKTVKTYHIDADLNQAGQAIKMVGDIDLNKEDMKLDVSLGEQHVVLIKVGEDVHASMDGGKTFVKGTQDMTASFSQFTGMWDNFKPEDIDKSKDALKDATPATETIDGVETRHMTANAKDLQGLNPGGGEMEEGTVDFWVSTNDKPTIRQMKIESQEISGTIKWSKLDEPVTIEPPAESAAPSQPAAVAANR